jgi:hypothetical protein
MLRATVYTLLACVIAGCSTHHGVDPSDERDAPKRRADAVGAAEPKDLGEPLTYYGDVKPIIDAKCGQCHFEGGIGPLPLTSFDEVHTFKDLVKVDVETGKMPPWTANAALDFYVGDRRLTRDQKNTIVRWVEQGAAEGDPGDEPEREPEVKRGLSRIDGTMKFPKPFTPPGKELDQYRCIPLDWPYEETKYLTGLSIEPDRREMVHHGIVYFVQPENADQVRMRDAETPDEVGYPCNGVNVGGAAWLTSYEPGGFGQDVPGGLGFEVRPGSIFVLQMHYNVINGVYPDQSRVDFKVEDRVDRIGRVSLLMNPLWIAGFMPIPAGQPDVMHAYAQRPVGMSASNGYNVYWVDLHMHQLGRSGSIGVLRADGTREGLLGIPKWDFAWQETYILQEPVRINPGDQLYVECHWNNSEENQAMVDGQRMPTRDVNWGDHTTDEMCLGAVLIGPPD